ncbi:hypothetical protein BC939DRAFT_210321 [Gamsiella multidivaricata]|uniref:uncharacterized protein n=1 Tax=Gamsiella multidivaricata TaxID=101098 RepID=UPI00221EDC1E|nr:uncharacterized protein BC939DRAFT_210321 [Gamsiella multidivaricata]KAI7821228.1 hypothetical protein BC939DRAFT_210321 [Gamsiella multidivaricata]
MFSSFKERLNTGLSNLHEKGVSTSATAANSPTPPSSIKATIPGTPDTTHAAGAEGIHDDKAGSLTSLASPHSPTPSSTPLAQGPPPTASSFVSLASRISGGVASTASSSSLFFRRPVQHQQAATQSSPSSLIVSGNAGLGSGVGGNIVGLGSSVSGGKLAELVQRLTLDPKDETPDKADLAAIREQYQSAGSTVHKQEQQLQQDKQGQEETQEEREHEEQQGQVQHQGLNENGLPEDVIEKLEILQRYEARFSDLAGAFKKIVQEKIAAEAVLKATTALEDLGDIEALQAHMQNMARKSEMSMQEIKRLSDELRETRAAKDTEAVSQAALIQDLRNQLSLRLEEIDRLKHRQKDLSASSDTLSLSDTLSVHHLDHSSDVDTKPNSIDLISTPSSPQPPSLSASALDPSLDSVTVNLPTVATSTASLTTPSPTSTVAKPKRATKDKDQALRELMARLESVLKEKNQAREDQEETVEQMEYWKRELGKEREANKAMAEKMDRLQAQIAEIEEQRKKEATAAGASPSTRRTIQEGVSEDASTDSTTTATTATTKTVDGVEDDSVEDRLSLLQNELCTVRLELAAALEREIALRKAHEELATLQQAYSALQTSKTKTERALDAAMGQIQELEDLAIALGETKQALVEAQEEVQERQQLLDLERQWREEAEKSRDTMKKEYDGAVRQARIEAEKGLQEKVRTLEQQVAEADTQRKTLEHAMIERSGAVEEIVVLKEKILQLGKELEDTATKQQAAFHALREEKEKVVAALITQQQQEQLRQSRIQELESELKELSTNKIPSFAQDSEADNKTDKEPSQETGNLAADKRQ